MSYLVLANKPSHVLGTVSDGAAQGNVVLHPFDASKKDGRLFVLDNEGYIHLASASNFVLDVSGGVAHEGTHVITYNKKGDHSKNQLWVNKEGYIHSRLDESFLLGANEAGQIIVTKQQQRVSFVTPVAAGQPFHWEKHEGELNVVAVGAGNHDVWGVNHLEHIYNWDGNKWHKIEGAAVNVSVGVDGTVWVVNKAHEIYRYDRVAQKWSIVPGQLVQVSVGSANHIWGVNHLENIYRWDAANNKWDAIEGAATNVSVGADGTAYVVNKAHDIYRWEGNRWQVVAGELVQIHVANANKVVGVNHLGHVYRLHDGSRWEKLDGELSWVAVGQQGELWGVNSGHNIFKAQL